MNEVKELDLYAIAKVLLKRAWIIVLCAIITALLTLGYTANFVQPMYQAQVTMYVNNNAGNTGAVSSGNLAVAMQLAKTYVNIIRSDRVLEKVIEETGAMLTTKQVRGAISAETQEETEMFTVRVTTQDPQLSADLANAIARVAPGEISNIIEGSSAKVIDYAKVPTSRTSPSYKVNTVVGAIIGAVLSAAFFVAQMLLDTRVKGEEDLKKICQIPVLGMIPDFAQPAKENEKKGRR